MKTNNLEIDPLDTLKENNDQYIILPDLTEEQKETINPLIPPTSGIRMVLMEKNSNTEELLIPKSRQCMFLRVFKAISEISKHEIKKDTFGILLVSDDRPTANMMVENCAKILAYDQHKIFFQKATDETSKRFATQSPFYSRMGTPHGSATVALSDDIDVVIVITASHNGKLWSGVKFYFNLPMPISGKVMQTVSEKAISYTRIPIIEDFQVQYIDANKLNTDYIMTLVNKIIDPTVLKDKSIIIWPYMGHAPEIAEIFTKIGAKVHVIPDQMEPPDPTVSIDYDTIKKYFRETNGNIAILLDSDRDRVVIVHKNRDTNEIETLMPNTLYSAMHNILKEKYGREIINVRTIPSDPRCDIHSKMTFLTGVGYKHLGMVLYGALDYEIEPMKFQTGLLYYKGAEANQKIQSTKNIRDFIFDQNFTSEEIIMALWEESGGHTFNLLKVDTNTESLKIDSILPPIGDKYPAPALLIIATMLESGFNLENAINQEIIGLRTKIPANEKQKVAIVDYFAQPKEPTLDIGENTYKINNFELINGKIAIIHLQSKKSNLYFRPSGTGPGVRIYIFGKKNTAELELKQVKDYIITLFQIE